MNISYQSHGMCLDLMFLILFTASLTFTKQLLKTVYCMTSYEFIYVLYILSLGAIWEIVSVIKVPLSGHILIH